jgi:hypothetical protein
MKTPRILRYVVVLLLSLAAFAALSVRPVAAQQLNPPPLVGSSCHVTGSGTICHGTSTSEFSASGVFCGAFQIIQSADVTTKATLFYNQDGNATQWVLHNTETGTFANSVSGASVPFTGHFTETFTFVTPGNFSWVTITITGQQDKVTLPGEGVVLHDAGRVVIAQGQIVFLSGPVSQEEQLCPFLS